MTQEAKKLIEAALNTARLYIGDCECAECTVGAQQIMEAEAALSGLSPEAQEIERLKAESDGRRRALMELSDERVALWRRAESAEAEVAALRAQLAAERARFDWWFCPAAKDINEYLRGVRERWSVEQWRAWIDAAQGVER